MNSQDLFEATEEDNAYRPLAARMRPISLDEYVGQQHILGAGKPLRVALEKGQVHSMILWGPPGVGKTSLAKLLTQHIDADFVPLSAVLAGVKDIRQAVARAQDIRAQYGKKTVLFVDEVHRFNKSQQDAFLPYVEDGTVVFVGATTENPSFEVNNALLSRSRVYVLKSLAREDLEQLVDHALSDRSRGLGERQLRLTPEARDNLLGASDGDARRLLNLLEIASDFVEDLGEIDASVVAELFTQDSRRFDKGGDVFYEQISALHKSVRGSDPDAALYWFTRMLDGGCDPLYVARRVVRMASEDIGNADPRGIQLALSAWDVQERLGSPEGELALAQAVVYLACAAKSNAVYSAYKAARCFVSDTPSYDVPMHLRNAPTRLMKDLDYGAEYRYAHNEAGGFAAGESYFPDDMPAQTFYEPVERGLEIQIAKKLRELKTLNAQALHGNASSERLGDSAENTADTTISNKAMPDNE